MPTLTKEQAVKEIAAIYKLAGLQGCFIYWDVKDMRSNPNMEMIQFPEDDDEVTEMHIAAFSTACVSPLYRCIMGMLSVAGIALDSLEPRPWAPSNAEEEYLRLALDKIGKGTVQYAYDKMVEPDTDIPVAFKECIKKLIAPLTKL